MRILALLIFLFLRTTLLAQGGSAVITLVMPPPSGNGSSALESGGAFATGATDLYYNPALLPDLERGTGAQWQFTNSYQNLLPVLRIPNLSQEYWGLSAVASDPKNGFDLGLGLFRNEVTFGGMNLYAGDPIPFPSKENVFGLGLGLRLGCPISLGVTAKYYDSHLSREGEAIGWAFDFGILINPRIHAPVTLRLPFVEINPSVAWSLQNVGSRAFYEDPAISDPIPRLLRFSSGVQTNFFDFFTLTLGTSDEQDIFRATEVGFPTRIEGINMNALGFSYSWGKLRDVLGQRQEVHFTKYGYEFNALRLFRAFKRIQTGDLVSQSQNFDKGFLFRKITVWGIPYRANPSFAFGRRSIRSEDNGIRNGQSAFYWSVSL